MLNYIIFLPAYIKQIWASYWEYGDKYVYTFYIKMYITLVRFDSKSYNTIYLVPFPNNSLLQLR